SARRRGRAGGCVWIGGRRRSRTDLWALRRAGADPRAVARGAPLLDLAMGASLTSRRAPSIANRSFSSDPDSDIAREFWWIDGEPCAHGCVVPLGNHSVSLEVHDERGAVHRTPDLWVQVNSGAACIET